MNFFFDNNVPRRVARALNELYQPEGHEIVHLSDRFEASADDELWIPRLGAEGGWSVITKDIGIQRKPDQRAIWRAAGLTVFFLKKGWYNVPFNLITLRMFKIWPDIVYHAINSPGSGITVPYKGRMKRFNL